jgi:NADH-quinone oxidoreductase subunit C
MLIEKLKERFGSQIVSAEHAHGEETIVVEREHVHDILRALRDDAEFAFDMLTDLTVVDWPSRSPRFDVVYHLNSLAHRHRLRVKAGVPEDDCKIASVTDLWKSADWLERECYDLFGIHFVGHPDLRRILMYDSFQGHPLRKDYPFQKRQPMVEETDPVLKPLRREI